MKFTLSLLFAAAAWLGPLTSVPVFAQAEPPIGQWEFESGDFSASLGDPLVPLGDTEAETEFGTTADFGLPNINGEVARVMKYPANTAAPSGYQMNFFTGNNGGGAFVNQWTIVYDLLFPAESADQWRALIETDTRMINPDADLFVNPAGGFGVDGQFHGQIQPNTWYRLGFVVDIPSNMLRKYINGNLVGVQVATSGMTAALDGRWALDPIGGYATLFNDDDGQAAVGYVNSIQLRSEALTTGQMQALGGPSAEGIPQEIPPIPSYVERWIPSRAIANRDTDLGVVINLGDTTIEDSSITLRLNGTPLTGLEITRDGSLLTIVKTDGAPLPVPTSNELEVTYTDSMAGEKTFSNSFSAVVFYEDFESLVLGPSVEEPLAGTMVWTKTPPPGWTIDDSGVPGAGTANDGRTEWAGWSFADRLWWVTADDQLRSSFTKGIGTVAIADPDEWDDAPHDPGMYNTYMTTAPIALEGLAPNSILFTFDSTWRDECCDDDVALDNSQTAVISVSYDGGEPVEILRWDSTPGSPFFHDDNVNETVLINLDNPAGAISMTMTFGLIRAENDWFWAIDNLLLSAGAIAPIITVQPQSQLASVGGTVTLTVGSEGTPPFTYQWQRDGEDIAGATGASLSLPNFQADAAGDYRVIVSNTAGSTTSAVARVEAFEGSITDDLVVHLKLDGDLTDSSERNNDAVAIGAPTFSTGQVGPNAIHIPSGQDYVSLGAPADLNFGTDSDFSFSFWARVVAYNSDPAFISNKDWNSGGNPGYVLAIGGGAAFQWNLAGAPGERKDFDGPDGTFTGGAWHHIAVTFDRDGEGVTYIDGIQVNGTVLSATPNNLDTPVGYNTNIGQDGTGAYGPAFTDADIDDVGIWRRRLTVQEVASIYAQGLIGEDLSTASSAPGLRITSVTRDESNLVITWSGGTGPFGIEMKSTVDGETWTEVATTENRTADIPFAATGAGFFRIRELLPEKPPARAG